MYFISIANSLEGEIVLNALLKSNCINNVICLLFIPCSMSSVNLSIAVSVLLCCLYPVYNGSSKLLLFKNAVIWSCTNFSKTVDKKQSNATCLKSEHDEGIGVFFIANSNDFFQANGKMPLNRDSLKSFTR